MAFFQDNQGKPAPER